MTDRARHWRRRAAVATAVVWLSGIGLAAEREELETDRDSFTFAPTTAGPGLSILESSYSFIDNRTGPEAHSVPETLLRRGIGDRLELRLGFNYEAGGPGTVSGSEVGGQDIETEDESRVLYGAKVETSEQDGWLPRSAAVVQGYTPTYGPSTVSTVVVGESWAGGSPTAGSGPRRCGTAPGSTRETPSTSGRRRR